MSAIYDFNAIRQRKEELSGERYPEKPAVRAGEPAKTGVVTVTTAAPTWQVPSVCKGCGAVIANRDEVMQKCNGWCI